MENLNAENIINEIQSLIKALKECGGWVKRGNGEGWFNHEILADALALINSQEQRIKELTEDNEYLKTQLTATEARYESRKESDIAEMLELRLNVEELTEENAEVKANWQKLKDSYDNNDKEWREVYADSQSKWEKAYEKLELTLEGVMHFVDKWLDGEELEQDEVNRAATMREKTLQIVEKLTEENERLRADLSDAEAKTEKAIDIAEDNIRAEIASGGTSCHWCEDKVKADTVRQMQERLKAVAYQSNDWSHGEHPMVVEVEDIDQIAKEILEGE